MSKAERLVAVIVVCVFYLAIRFLSNVGESIEDIAFTLNDRVASLEDKITFLEAQCHKE